MKIYLARQILRVLLLTLIIYSCGIAQSDSVEKNNYDCEQQPLGLFREITGSTMKLSSEYNNAIFLNKESDLQENRWTPDPLDEVDPAYQFYLIRNPSGPAREKCGATMEVVGKLISPMGKLFDFKQATYDIPSRKLKFTTIERDGITYEGEIQFNAESKFVKGIFEKGVMNLKASGKSLGIVTMEFRFTS
jgi:hypothetical protein